MLKINYVKNLEDAKNLDDLMDAINYEKNCMSIQVNEDAITKQDVIIKNVKGTKTPEDIQAAKVKKIQLEEDIEELKEENIKLFSVYVNVLNSIVSTSNGYTNNNRTAARNILRLSACGDDKRFFKYAVLTDSIEFDNLYKAMEIIHNVNDNSVSENGLYKNNTKNQKAADAVKQTLVNLCKKLFSIQVENEYTQKINVRFNKTELGLLHECYTRGIDVKINKDKNGNKKYTGISQKTAIIRTKKSDGSYAYNGTAFIELLAKIAFGHICG